MSLKSVFENKLLRVLLPPLMLGSLWLLFNPVKFKNIDKVRSGRACQEEAVASNMLVDGVVTEKFLTARKVRMFKYVADGDTLTSELLAFELTGAYDFLNEGDLILKRNGKLELEIHRLQVDTLLVIDYGCKH